MRIPRLKISLRTLMLLVVAFVLGMAADDIRHHHAPFMKRAKYYALERSMHLEQLKATEDSIETLQATPDASEGRASELEAAKDRREVIRMLAGQCDDLRARFERAAWIPFAPPPDENILQHADSSISMTSTIKSTSVHTIGPNEARGSESPNP